MQSRMAAVPEEDFANLENVTQTVEIVKKGQPLRSYPTVPGGFDMIASCEQQPQRFQSKSLPNVDACCFIGDLRKGIRTWIFIEVIIWFLLFCASFYHEIIFIQTNDLFEFFDIMNDSWYSILVFGNEVWEVNNNIKSEFNRQRNSEKNSILSILAMYVMINLVLILIFLTYVVVCILLLAGNKAVRFLRNI
jgi:hypothetical protein